MIKRFIAVMAMYCMVVQMAFPCTIFKMTRQDRTLIGNSEDWSGTDSKVWFLAPGPGSFGRVCFGFGNGWVQGGMNSEGLFFDAIAGPVKPWKVDPLLKDYPGNLCENILAECSTVEEAVQQFRTHNVPSLVVGIFVFVDRSGKTAVIQYRDNRLSVVISEEPVYGIGYRGERAESLLSQLDQLNMNDMDQVLRQCRRMDQYPTRYTCVYDPAALQILVHCTGNGNESVLLDMKTVLSGPGRYCDLADLQEQLNGPRRTDHKTADATQRSEAQLDGCVGTYGSGEETLTIHRDGNLLLLETPLVLDGVMQLVLTPVSEDTLVCRDLNVSIAMERTAVGTAGGVTLTHNGVTRQFSRTPATVH